MKKSGLFLTDTSYDAYTLIYNHFTELNLNIYWTTQVPSSKQYIDFPFDRFISIKISNISDQRKQSIAENIFKQIQTLSKSLINDFDQDIPNFCLVFLAFLYNIPSITKIYDEIYPQFITFFYRLCTIRSNRTRQDQEMTINYQLWHIFFSWLYKIESSAIYSCFLKDFLIDFSTTSELANTIFFVQFENNIENIKLPSLYFSPYFLQKIEPELVSKIIDLVAKITVPNFTEKEMSNICQLLFIYPFRMPIQASDPSSKDCIQLDHRVCLLYQKYRIENSPYVSNSTINYFLAQISFLNEFRMNQRNLLVYSTENAISPVINEKSIQIESSQKPSESKGTNKATQKKAHSMLQSNSAPTFKVKKVVVKSKIKSQNPNLEKVKSNKKFEPPKFNSEIIPTLEINQLKNLIDKFVNYHDNNQYSTIIDPKIINTGYTFVIFGLPITLKLETVQDTFNFNYCQTLLKYPVSMTRENLNLKEIAKLEDLFDDFSSEYLFNLLPFVDFTRVSLFEQCQIFKLIPKIFHECPITENLEVIYHKILFEPLNDSDDDFDFYCGVLYKFVSNQYDEFIKSIENNDVNESFMKFGPDFLIKSILNDIPPAIVKDQNVNQQIIKFNLMKMFSRTIDKFDDIQYFSITHLLFLFILSNIKEEIEESLCSKIIHFIENKSEALLQIYIDILIYPKLLSNENTKVAGQISLIKDYDDQSPSFQNTVAMFQALFI